MCRRSEEGRQVRQPLDGGGPVFEDDQCLSFDRENVVRT